MTQTKELTGFVTAITNTPEVMILTFQESKTQHVLALTLPTDRITEAFPAGEPDLGIELVAVVTEEGEDIMLQSLYNPDGDFIAADEMSEWCGLDADETNMAAIDIYDKLIAQREALLHSVTLSPEELDELAAEHDHDKSLGQVETNYGNPVTGQEG